MPGFTFAALAVGESGIVVEVGAGHRIPHHIRPVTAGISCGPNLSNGGELAYPVG